MIRERKPLHSVTRGWLLTRINLARTEVNVAAFEAEREHREPTQNGSAFHRLAGAWIEYDRLHRESVRREIIDRGSV